MCRSARHRSTARGKTLFHLLAHVCFTSTPSLEQCCMPILVWNAITDDNWHAALGPQYMRDLSERPPNTLQPQRRGVPHSIIDFPRSCVLCSSPAAIGRNSPKIALGGNSLSMCRREESRTTGISWQHPPLATPVALHACTPFRLAKDRVGIQRSIWSNCSMADDSPS